MAEAPAFPANSKATGYWFPRSERSLATAIFDAAAKFSNVIGVPLVAFAVVTFGWRWGFGLTALLSFAYFVAYWIIYRDPSADAKLSREELNYIRQGGATPEGASEASPFAMLGYLLRNRKVWGLTIGFAAYGYCFYLFLTWLPGYLVTAMHMSIIKSAGYAAIPWLCATVSDLVVGGWLIDRLIARGYDETRVRKTVLVGGMVLGLAVFGATATTTPFWAIFWISIALSGLAAAAPVGWSIPSLIAPRGGTGRDRRRDELLQQPDGGGGAGGDRRARGSDELVRDAPSWWPASCCSSAFSPMSWCSAGSSRSRSRRRRRRRASAVGRRDRERR